MSRTLLCRSMRTFCCRTGNRSHDILQQQYCCKCSRTCTSYSPAVGDPAMCFSLRKNTMYRLYQHCSSADAILRLIKNCFGGSTRTIDASLFFHFWHFFVQVHPLCFSERIIQVVCFYPRQRAWARLRVVCVSISTFHSYSQYLGVKRSMFEKILPKVLRTLAVFCFFVLQILRVFAVF